MFSREGNSLRTESACNLNVYQGCYITVKKNYNDGGDDNGVLWEIWRLLKYSKVCSAMIEHPRCAADEPWPEPIGCPEGTYPTQGSSLTVAIVVVAAAAAAFAGAGPVGALAVAVVGEVSVGAVCDHPDMDLPRQSLQYYSSSVVWEMLLIQWGHEARVGTLHPILKSRFDSHD